MTKKLQIWGDTGSGKSTLLTGALFHQPEDKIWKYLNRNKSQSEIYQLYKNWQRLTHYQLMTTTSSDRIEVNLHFDTPHKSQAETVQVIDIRGSLVHNLSGERVQEWVQAADGILFTVPWEQGPMADDFIRRHMELVKVVAGFAAGSDKLLGLAITKCEQVLTYTQMEKALKKPNWFEDYPVWRENKNTLKLLPENSVWATSAFGFNESRNETQPACLIGEFGGIMPYNIQPMNLMTPFYRFLKAWQLCP